MDDTTKSILDRITINYPRPTKIPNGLEVTTYYDCAQLSPNDLARLAAQATGHLKHGIFEIVVGVAYNGILFASAVAGGKMVSILQADGKISGPTVDGKKVLVVDDVVNLGGRLLDAEKKLVAMGAIVVGFACIVDRSAGKFGSEEKPLWSAYQTSFS